MGRARAGTKRIWAFAATVLLIVACACLSAAAAGGHQRAAINLLRNANGTVGAFSVQGWDSVTIPGWQITRGLPTVVRYGTAGFPRAAAPLKALFVGGPGGTATLAQTVSLRSPRGALPATGTSFRMSAWLGGNRTSAASVTVLFLSRRGRVLGARTIGPIDRGKLADRRASGLLPRGSASARILLRLASKLKNYDGPNAPIVGYNRAAAGRLSFSVSTLLARPPRISPPAAEVPRFDHVFLFMFENQDYRAVIGNRRQATYLNGLLSHGTLLTNLFAEEHPSDANYLAIAAGGAFGIPLTDPLEINPHFSVHARNIGDLIDTAHQTWRAYLQSAAGPCDDTVHGFYWNDDLPFLYFPHVRDRPAYCAEHVVPLEAMSADLASPKTTPSFAWIAADDCSDMEGCGLRRGDQFLAGTLGAIMNSPAWRDQRSLAIITMDEDGYDEEHPPQRVATIVLGSRDVRQGYVSHVRYTHYSLLRTIEAALGLGTLTRNDRYAQPLNDVFDRHAHDTRDVALPAESEAPRGPALPNRSWTRGNAARLPGEVALVANYQSNTVTPVSLASGKAGKAIAVGAGPDAIALAPGGGTAYVANSGSGSVTPIDTASLTAGRAIPVGSHPCAIAVSPDGRTAYVVDGDSNEVTPISTATNRALNPIAVGAYPRKIAISPDGSTAYVVNWGGGSVTPIDLATGLARAPIPVGSYPAAITFSPDGTTAYIANYGSSTITPFDTVTDVPAGAIAVGQAPNSIVDSPDGAKVLAVSGDTDSVTPVNVAGRRAGRGITVGYSPLAIALAPGTATAWVASAIAGTVTPISTLTGRAGRPVSVGAYSYPTSITFVPGRAMAVVLNTYGGTISLLDSRRRRITRTVTVGAYPDSVAIVR